MNNDNEVKINVNVIFGVVVLITALVGATGYFYGKSTNTQTTAVPSQPAAATQQPAKVDITMDQVKSLFDGKNISFGNKDSKVLFVEFSDPSCPYCHVAAGKNPELNKQMGQQFILKADGGAYVPPVPEMKKLVDEGKAGFVWIYANGHGNGELATIAQYCAQEKGKFWEVHDLLMSDKGYEMVNTTVKNDKTKSGVLADFLNSAVKSSEMKACIDSGKYDDRPTTDMAIARQFGFQGTPSFFVNTQNFSGAYSFTNLQSTVDGALKY